MCNLYTWCEVVIVAVCVFGGEMTAGSVRLHDRCEVKDDRSSTSCTTQVGACIISGEMCICHQSFLVLWCWI
jgi:carbonic anhydrase/acetyltransferase-like protein (isoleucine patch superfamily)